MKQRSSPLSPALLVAACLAGAALFAADERAVPAPEITDFAITELQTKAKESTDKKVAEIERVHLAREAFALAFKNERVAFEKKLGSDLAGFLTRLQKMPAPGRRQALAEFTEKQRKEREDFGAASRIKVDDFRRKNAEVN